MDQTVDGAVGGCLQRVVGAVQPVLQRLQTESQTVVLKLFNYPRSNDSNELFGIRIQVDLKTSFDFCNV